MIEAWTGLFGQTRGRNFRQFFDYSRDEGLGSGRGPDVERAAAAIAARAVRTTRHTLVRKRLMIVLRHARPSGRRRP